MSIFTGEDDCCDETPQTLMRKLRTKTVIIPVGVLWPDPSRFGSHTPAVLRNNPIGTHFAVWSALLRLAFGRAFRRNSSTLVAMCRGTDRNSGTTDY